MIILNIAIIIFIIMESVNIFVLYFLPDSRFANGMGVFNHWFKSKENRSNTLFVKYMVNWVAGTKLIFIVLLLVILLTGGETTKLFAVFAMILLIATYYIRLNPIIKKLDEKDEITPKGYAKKLSYIITGYMLMFILATVIYFFIQQ